MIQKYLIPACILVLLPLLVLGFFNFPSADDFTYALMAINKGFIGAQLEWYQTWSGRYISSALLSVSPIVYGSLTGYKFVGILTFLLFMLTSYYFVTALLKNVIDKKHLLVAYFLFSLVYICEMPSISEAFHWYPGVVNYTLALVLFIYGLGFYLRATGLSFAKNANIDFNRNKYSTIFVLSVLSFLLPGVNESLVVVWLYLIAVLIALVYLYKKQIQWSLFIPIFAGLVGFYIVYKAPGNLVRAAQFEHKHDILFTIFRPLGLSVELFFRYLKPSFVLFLFLMLPFFQQLKSRVEPRFYSPRFRILTFLGYVSILFLFLAPAHWAMGGAPARRAMNILCYIHVVFVFIMYCQWLWARPEKTMGYFQKICRYFPQKAHVVVFVLSLFVISNIGESWADLLFRAPTFAKEQNARIEQMRQAGPEADVILPVLTYKPETLYFSDLTEDSNDWINQAVSKFFNVKSVVVGK